jgi:NADPH:quinone reductase-like Zn-dependent oxidoreductase
MLAVGFHEFGSPDVLGIVDLATVTPADEEVRVRVHASTVNPADVQYRAGKYAQAVSGARTPLVGGLEFAGTVDRVGDRATWKIGDRVMGMTKFIPGGRGCHAEQVVVHSESLAALPRDGSFSEYATLPMSGLTARQALDRLALGQGQTAVVTGAAGAVGAYIVQLAVREGIDVIAVAGASDEDFVRGCGAGLFVARGETALAEIRDARPSGVDAVFDLAIIGEPVTQVLAPAGTVACFKPYQPDLYTSVRPEVISAREYLREPAKLRELATLADSGHLRLRVAETVPFQRAASAHRWLERGGLRGRIVLDFA